ncbi:hypothetical protein GRF59_06955 [Paenibacillus sp. HJL G12]|uniref:Uncharacterized protein n=1 Tax=Paenibacillus dendrobii TaxID=2691084 RepID=A0A7X3LHL5_9BACL|nr:hypothetical protein [Paenibacillus dendrobii]MWV43369.1 hypothetical protein [Paenibacillus dendrobii]
MHTTVDRAIKETWLYNIKSDYSSNFILLEDSLKNAFYFHLRNRLSDAFLKDHNLRIYTELHTGYGERIDIAVVEIEDREDVHLREKIKDYVAVIELKYKSGHVPIDPFFGDIQKIKSYLKRNDYVNCQYYLGFIHETEYRLEETSWLNTREQKTWASGSLTELSGFYNEDKIIFTNISYNHLNADLNNIRI